MKINNLMVFIFVVLVICMTQNLISETQTTIKGKWTIKKNIGSLNWNGVKGKGCYCSPGGSNCKLTLTQTTTTSSAVVSQNNVKIFAKIDQACFAVNDSGGAFTTEIVNTPIKLPEGTTYTILEAKDYPNLVGRVIDVSGLMTDENNMIVIEYAL